MNTAPTAPAAHEHHQSYWLWVMCLTGVDYFSTLGYQPSIAVEAAGALAPLATIVLVLVTLLGALPVYSHVASQSPHGQGSIAMLERLVRGWSGKILVLVLLGFAATDFVITKTLSAADAAEHIQHNPLWAQHAPSWLHSFGEDRQRVVLTMGLLVALGASFMRGFREVIGMAVAIVGVYLVLNLLIVGFGLQFLAQHPDHFWQWWERVTTGDWHLAHAPLEGHSFGVMIAVSLLVFPKLALGLSGFETGVAVMPLIRGRDDDDPAKPRGRIRNARKLLVTAAVIMSFFLLGSAIVTATLIPPHDIHTEGKARNRALAYLAHGEAPEAIAPFFGEIFGTAYDISTVMILAFAGASAMAGLLNLMPRYLPRYGMAPEWARAVRPLVLLFTIINLFVTWWFNADVIAQGGAYATGVLVLISSACLATVIDLFRTREGSLWARAPKRYLLITAAFLYTMVANMIERPDGLKIASFFILGIIVSSIVSRVQRSTELRLHGFEFADAESKFLWDSVKHLEFPVLVPHRPGNRRLTEKERIIRDRHRLSEEVPIVFLEASLEDPSEFEQVPLVRVFEQEGKFVIKITRCASIAHVIAAVALELSQTGKPPEVHFGWSDESPVAASVGFLLLGEGNVPWMVRKLICEAQPDPERQPQVIIG